MCLDSLMFDASESSGQHKLVTSMPEPWSRKAGETWVTYPSQRWLA
jgi:hypothetical protein